MEGALGAGVEGGGEAVEEVGGLEVGEGGMGLAEGVEVGKDFVDDGVDDVVGDVGGGDEGGGDANGGDVFLVCGHGVEVDGKGGGSVVGEGGDKVLGGDGEEAHGASSGGGFADGAVGMADGIEEAVEAVVLNESGGFGGGEGFGSKVGLGVESGGAEDVEGIGTVSGAGIAKVNVSATEVGEVADAGVVGDHEGDDFGMKGEDGAKGGDGLAIPGTEAIPGLVVKVGLGHAEVDLAGGDGVEVEDGSAGGFDGHANGVVAVLVDEAGDGSADGVVDAGDAAGADGGKVGSGGGATASGKEGGGEEEGEDADGGFHEAS